MHHATKAMYMLSKSSKQLNAFLPAPHTAPGRARWWFLRTTLPCASHGMQEYIMHR